MQLLLTGPLRAGVPPPPPPAVYPWPEALQSWDAARVQSLTFCVRARPGRNSETRPGSSYHLIRVLSPASRQGEQVYVGEDEDPCTKKANVTAGVCVCVYTCRSLPSLLGRICSVPEAAVHCRGQGPHKGGAGTGLLTLLLLRRISSRGSVPHLLFMGRPPHY